MKASVIITVYNLDRYVDQTILSALNQSHPDVEVIVVDDASTDESVQRISAFGDRVRLVRNDTNAGVLRSTLRGLGEATGDVLCFLDGDDLWERDKVAETVAIYARDELVIACSHDCSTIDSKGKQLSPTDLDQRPTRAALRTGDADVLDQSMRESVLAYRGQVWLGSAWSIRRSAVDLLALEAFVDALPEARFTYQDHPIATFVALTAKGRFSYVDRVLMQYRVHGANHSGGVRDVQRALHVVHKGWATHQATLQLIERYAPQRRDLVRRQTLLLREYDYLRAVYDGSARRAIRPFFACAVSGWGARRMAKEASRGVLAALLGPEGFLAWHAKLSTR